MSTTPLNLGGAIFGGGTSGFGQGLGSGLVGLGKTVGSFAGTMPQPSAPGTGATNNIQPMAKPGTTVGPINSAPIQASPTQIQAAVNTAGAQAVTPQGSPASTTTVAPAPTPGVPAAPAPGTIPGSTAQGVAGGVVPAGDFNSVYGVDTGTAVAGLLNSESPGNAASAAQAVINANAPNVAQGMSSLEAGLAASGISPNSSVAAMEKANYMSGVEQQNLSEEAQFNLSEQDMQQNLLENLLPAQEQRQLESSPWTIAGDVIEGAGAALQL